MNDEVALLHHDIKEQKALLDLIRTDYENISIAVNESEKIRRQLRDMMPMVPKDMSEKVEKMDSLLTVVENNMIQLKHTGKGQDVIRLPGMLLEKLGYLASTVAIADFKPADQYVAVYEKLHAEWLEVQQAWEQLKSDELNTFQNTLKEAQIGPLIMGSED